MELVLRLPLETEESEFLRARAASATDLPTFLHGYRDGMTMAQFLLWLDGRERGENLVDAQVPTTFRFAFVGPRIVGRVAIRHRLTAALEREGGHIGYAVLPEFRRQGYATEILRLAIPIARERSGAVRLLVTCDEDNLASRRTIERNGGVLEDIVMSEQRGRDIRRYWINTRSAPG